MTLDREAYQLLFDQHPQAMLILDGTSQSILAANQAALGLYGYAREEMLSLGLKQLTGVDAASGQIYHLRRDGAQLQVEFQFSQLNFSGQASTLAVIQERSRSEALLQDVLTSMGDGVWEWDLLSDSCFYSSQWKAILGHTESEIGTALAEWSGRVHPEDLPRCMESLREHFAGQQSQFKLEHRLRCADGSYKWMLSRGRIVGRTGSGEPARMVGTITDITDLKALEASLRESENRWKYALEGSGDGVWDWDLLSGDTYYSSQWKAILGHAEHEIGTSAAEWLERVHPDDLPMLEALSQAYSSGNQCAHELEHRMRCADGSYKWLLCRGQMVSWTADGKPARLMGTITDISRQKKLEESLRASEERLTLAKSSGLIGVWDLDLLTGACHWDDVALKTYGLEPGQNEQNLESWQKLMHPEDFHKITGISFEQIGTEPFHLEHRIIRPDGELRYLEAHGRVLWNEQNQPYRMLGVNLDITERKQAEAALRDSNDKWQALISQTKDAVMISDFESAYLVEANPQACAMFGYSLEELQGLKGIDLNPPEYRQLANRLSAELHAHGSAREARMPMMAKDGRIFWGDIRITVIEVGARKMMVVIIRDVSQAVASEQELILAKEQAEAASRAKSEFLANMSHEIRTPMNGIIGMAELLRAAATTPEQGKFAEIIRQSGESLLALLNDILDFSKVEACKLELEQTDFDLGDLLTQSCSMLALDAYDKGLDLLTVIAPDVPMALSGDPARLRQVLLNLMSNALKFTPSGQILVRVTRESAGSGGERLGFAVEDTGIGVSPELREAIFSPFTQGDGSTTRKYGGTGLGLAISKQLVELMGGRLGLESESGLGSRFWFEIPLRQALDSPAAKLATLPAEAILISPQAGLRAALSESLTERGCRVSTSQSVAEALSLSLAPDSLILLDWPVMHEQPELAALRQACPQARILLLAYPLQEKLLSEPERAACDAWINKPLLLPELAAAMAELHGPAQLESPLAFSQRKGAAAIPLGLRILLAEDNPINQVVAQAVLAKLGCDCELVANGREALEALSRRSFDLVLMDCQMPEIDGYEATRLIRQGSGVLDPAITVVALTAHALEGDRERCLAAGMNDYLAKPFTLQDLAEVLMRWMPQRTAA